MKESEYKVGDKLLLAYMYGDTLDANKYRYGEPVEVIVDKVDYITNRDSYLYKVKRKSNFNDRYVYSMISAHWLFKLDELNKCKKFIEEHLD